MTNFEKYRDTDEALEAFRNACAKEGDYYCDQTQNCPYFHKNNPLQGCFHKWLASEYIELKPCPFCGGKAIVDIPPTFPLYRVKCSVCENRTDLHTFKRPAIEAWNRRV